MKTKFIRSMATEMTKVVGRMLARLHLRPGQYAQFWAWLRPSQRSRSLPYLFVLTILILLPLSAAAANLQTATRSVSLGLPSSADWVAGADKPDSAMGDTATTVGDVNGDGYEDLLVGAFGYRTIGWNDGRTYLFLGSASGLNTTPAWTVEGGPDCHDPFCNIGRGIGAAGDVNGDGYDDVIVASNIWNNGQYREGRAFLYYGSANELAATANWSVESNQAYACLGWIAGTAGDVNGDGYDDIIVTAGDFDGDHRDEGRAFLFLGSPTGLSCGAGCPVDASTAANWRIETHQAYAKLWPAGAAGDVNGDGYDDVFVGSPLYNDPFTDEGRVWVYLGSPSGLSSTAAWSVAGGQASAQLGPGSGAAGDVNGDGYDDLLVAAHLYDNGQQDEGRVWLYLGSANGLATTPAWSAEGDQSGADFGYAHSSRVAGDLDGDGYADVIIGAYGYDNGQTDEGRAFLYMGSPAGLTVAPVWSAESNQSSAMLGFSAGTAGDVNGDGYADLFVGAPYYDLSPQLRDSGATFVYYSHPPTAAAGGPYTVVAGETIQLDGSGSFGYAVGDTLVYTWDLDGDGNYGESGPAATRGDEIGVTPTFSAVGLQAPRALTVNLRVTDQGGFSASDEAAVSVIDTTPPVITPAISGVLGNNGWYVSDVSVQWTVSDAESAVSSTSGCDATTINTDSAGVTLTCTATSAGGSNSQHVTIRIDKSAPAVVVTGITHNAIYILGSVPVAGCQTEDLLAGVATPAILSVTGGNGDGTGTFTATCSGASDNAGNAAPVVSATYQVIYNWAGFLPPVDNPPVINSVNAGQAIPVKFSLGGDFGLNIFASGYPKVQSLACGSTGKSSDARKETMTAGNSTLQYDPSTQTYTYVWKTDKAWAGACRQLIVKLIDGAEHSALFRFHGKTPGTSEGEDEFATDVTPRIFLPLVSR